MADQSDFIEALGHRIQTEAPAQEFFTRGDRVIALLDPDKGPYHPNNRYANLVCYAADGTLVWRAELPTSGGGDCYFKVRSEDPIVVSSFSSYRCTIDPETGRIVDRTFLK